VTTIIQSVPQTSLKGRLLTEWFMCKHYVNMPLFISLYGAIAQDWWTKKKASSIYDSTYAWRDNILTLKTCTGTYRNKW
jgi:hypothetical protein